ncbi:MAG: hypothetical protein WBP51_05955, partial [Candidatus Sulfotelmatobacter sp.]
MRYTRPLLFFLSLALTLTAQSKFQSAKIEASSVWQLPPQFMTTAHAACDRSASSDYADCMINQMTKAGAPADAVQFTRELY